MKNNYLTKQIRNTFLVGIVAIAAFSDKIQQAQAQALHSDTLYPVADAYIKTYGGGEGKNTFMKFDISSIPANAVVSSVVLEVYVTERAVNWDDDVKFMNVNSQTWVETDLETTLWGFLRTDTLQQLLGFGTALGWASSIDIQQIFLRDYNPANSFCTVMLKDPDDITSVPAGGNPAYNSNDSLMTGNIFNDYIVYAPREYSNPAFRPRLIVNYDIAPAITTQPVNVTVCDGGVATFSVTATGDAPLSYQWQKNGIDIGGATSDIYTINPVTPASAGNYRCYVTNAFGSDTSNTALLTVNPLPVVALGADVTQCGGTVLLDAGNPGATHLWSDASTNSTLLVSVTGTYSVDVTDANGCSASDAIDVTINALPVITAGSDVTICLGSCATLSASGGISYSWSTGSTSSSIIECPVTTTSYSVIGTDANGCSASDVVTVTILLAQSPPLVEGIENPIFPPAGWTRNNPDGLVTWERTTAAAKTGIASMFMENFNYAANGPVDEMISPLMDLSTTTNPALTFQVAYQLYTDPSSSPNYSDTLMIQVSTDCGNTWNTLYSNYSTTLTTVTPVFSTNPFVPTANDWRMETVTLPAVADVFVKFRHSTDYENNLYVDDINIGALVSADEVNLDNVVTVFPNPTSGLFEIQLAAGYWQLASSQKQEASIEIYNVYGEKVYSAIRQFSNSTIDLSSQPGGIYFVEIKSEKTRTIKKIVLNK